MVAFCLFLVCRVVTGSSSLAIWVGCGLGRSELAQLTVEEIRIRQEH